MSLNDNEKGIDHKFYEDKSAQDYSCAICLMVPNPEIANEDVNCGKIFCEECINKWMTERRNCPDCNQHINKRRIKTDNKLLYKILLKMKIFCPLECNWKGTVDEYYNKHIIDCPKKTFPCKYKCAGCKFIGTKSELVEHENDKKEHLKIAANYIEELEKIKKETVFKYKKSYNVTVHQHPLIAELYINPPASSWCCDGRKLEGGCCSGLTDFYQARGMSGFRCAKCDYDLCLACLKKYIKVD